MQPEPPVSKLAHPSFLSVPFARPLSHWHAGLLPLQTICTILPLHTRRTCRGRRNFQHTRRHLKNHRSPVLSDCLSSTSWQRCQDCLYWIVGLKAVGVKVLLGAAIRDENMSREAKAKRKARLIFVLSAKRKPCRLFNGFEFGSFVLIVPNQPRPIDDF